MQQKTDSNLLPGIFIAIIVLLGGAGFVSMVQAVWRGGELSGAERFLITGLLIVVEIGIVYVIIQKIAMREQETFRREKW